LWVAAEGATEASDFAGPSAVCAKAGEGDPLTFAPPGWLYSLQEEEDKDGVAVMMVVMVKMMLVVVVLLWM
jgi:hypothetical protein